MPPYDASKPAPVKRVSQEPNAIKGSHLDMSLAHFSFDETFRDIIEEVGDDDQRPSQHESEAVDEREQQVQGPVCKAAANNSSVYCTCR